MVNVLEHAIIISTLVLDYFPYKVILEGVKYTIDCYLIVAIYLIV
jgi:hypothetical protein